MSEMYKNIEEMIGKLSPKLRGIAFKLNGHFTFFDEDDLFQEALEHLYVSFGAGKFNDKTDSYILQGCYYHLKNYIRKTMDNADIVSLDKSIDDKDGLDLNDALASRAPGAAEEIDSNTFIQSLASGRLSSRELKVLKMILEGLTVREIGNKLAVSHVMVIKIKKGIESKLRAVRKDLGNTKFS